MPPRALTPSGIILVDKPAGPTSFAIVAATRRRTGARTGHAGTLDPFATGLLLLLSGASTRLQPRFVGLAKRYETAIENKLYRALNQLERLQRLRGGEKIPAPVSVSVGVETS